MDEKKSNRIIKLLSIIAFSLIVFALIVILYTPSITVYEINIYNTYPWYFWLSIILSTYIGTLILLASYSNKVKNHYWILGFAAILLSNFILLAIPIIQNYLILGRGDILTHIGWMKDIVNTGTFGNDMYPILHILGVAINYFSGTSLESVTFVFPVFSLFYILSFYLLYTELLKDKSKVVLAMIFTSIMVFGTSHTSFSPFNLSFFAIPIFFYLYFREKSIHKWNYRILLLIAAVFLLLFHPLTALLLLLSIVLIEFSIYIYHKINHTPEILPNENQIKENSRLKYSGNFFYILIAVFIAGLLLWLPYLYLIENGLSIFYSFIINGSAPNLDSTLATANKANLIDLIYSSIFIFGFLILIILYSLLAIYKLTKKNFNRLKIRSLNFFDIFYSLEIYEIFSIIGFLFFAIVSIIVYFKLPLFGFTRIIDFSIIYANFLILYLFYLILTSKRRSLNLNKYVKILFISILIIPLIGLSTLNLYESPITLTPNEQIMSSEVNGMTIFFQNNDNRSGILELGISQYRFEAYIFGEQSDKYGQDIHIRNLSNNAITMPIDHFGFANNTSLGKYYNNSPYLLVNDIGYEMYPEIYPGYENKWRFTSQDFNMLNDSQQIMLIYNNGNLRIYKAIT